MNLEHLKNHYNNFKPTLDQIKTLQTKDESVAHNLTNLTELKRVVKKDLEVLTSRPYTFEGRQEYYKEVFPTYSDIPKLNEYREICENLADSAELNPLLTHTVHFFNNNSNMIEKAAFESRFYQMSSYPDRSEVIHYFSDALSKLTGNQLELLLEFANGYEMFTLVTLEPYMISILGNYIFFKSFFLLHKTGGLIYIVNESVQRQKNLRNPLIAGLTRFAESPIYNNYSSAAVSTSIFGLGIIIGKYAIPSSSYFSTPTRDIQPSKIAQNAVDRAFQSRGLGSPTIRAIVVFGSAVSFEVGRALTLFTKSFFEGIISAYKEGKANSVDREIDRATDNHKKDNKRN